jgi:hypothetical protein
MYNENWAEFEKTMQGVQRALIDMYNDMNMNFSKTLNWNEFTDRFVVILIADGYQNLKQDFKEKAQKLGIFHEDAIRPFIKTLEHANNREELMNIFEIREMIKIKLESDDP